MASVDQPKPIRTVPIRPEGSDTSGRPFGEEPSRSPPTTRATPNTRTATTTTAPAPAARTPSRDQPLSLDPASPAQANEPVRPQQRTVTPPAPRETAAPAPRLAAVPPTGGAASSASNGGYVVQVSSQRSEADAQASYRGLQAKYSQLKSHQAMIRRADLGAKGVYYRAMVGPFESGDEAVQFCNGLKQAGGQCIILRN
jgi:cell division protein FtsN